MAAHKNQHYVPKFLLRNWCIPGTGKLHCFHLDGSDFRSKVKGLNEVASDDDLWTVIAENGKRDRSIESKAYAIADRVGSEAHRMLLAGEPLNDDKRMNWALFIASLIARDPARIAAARAWGRKNIKNPGGPVTERTLEDWAVLLATAGHMSMKYLEVSLSMRWSVHDVSAAAERLLLGDWPLVVSKERRHPDDLYLMLPLAPTQLFCAVMGEGTETPADTWNVGELVKVANESTLAYATKEVYALDNSLEAQAQVAFASKTSMRPLEQS